MLISPQFSLSLCLFSVMFIAELGSSVIIPCSHSDDYINTVLWYKHSVGKKPLLIAYSEHGSGSVTYQNGFNNTNRYFIRSEPDSFNLTIVHLEEYDFVTYYCAVSFLNMITFGEGTILLHKGEFMTISELHPQSDCTCILHSGDSVTLQCSVISQICAGEYRVYWFRHSSGHSDPGIIYTHDNRSDQCMERSESSSSIQSCVYSLSQTELTPSDAGIYYCAVATCGKIHLGNGTKLIIEVECYVFYIFIVAHETSHLCVYFRFSHLEFNYFSPGNTEHHDHDCDYNSRYACAS
uniref:Novel immune-type receptor 3b n=1 Tax=Cyprinus carpio TaxID=7962 RepID=A0A8C2HI52_CYPCA